MKKKFLFCVSSLYSCWRKKDINRKTSKFEKTTFVLLSGIFVLTVIWLYCWSIIHNDASEANNFLFEELKSFFHYYILILCVSVGCVVYVLFVMLSGLIKVYIKQYLHLHLCHKITFVLVLAIAVAGFIFIGMFWSDQWDAIQVSFQIIAPFLQLAAIVIWVAFGWYLAHCLQNASNRACKAVSITLYSSFYIFLCSTPLWFYSPCITDTLSFTKKQHLFAHRGAAAIRPENTILAFEKSLEYDVYGFESDVRISADGVAFLMHDASLLRTTDVSSKFPSRKNERAETFTWKELQQLNAGKWFLSTNPFLLNHQLTKVERQEIAQQKIPSLAEYIMLAARHNKSVMFDLSKPPAGHTFYYSYVNITIETILNSSINQQQVLWLSSEYLNVVRSLAPYFVHVAHSAVQNASAYGIDVFDLLHSDVTTSVTSLGYPLIAYTVNDEWVFSRTWCVGVWAVTTDYPHYLHKINKPLWYMTTSQFLGAWITIDLIGILVLVIISICYYKKCKISSNLLDGSALNSQMTSIENIEMKGDFEQKILP